MSLRDRLGRLQEEGRKELEAKGMNPDNKVAATTIGAMKPVVQKAGSWVQKVTNEWREKSRVNAEHRKRVQKVYIAARQSEDLNIARRRGRADARKSSGFIPKVTPKTVSVGRTGAMSFSEGLFGLGKPPEKKKDGPRRSQMEDFFL